MSQAGWWEFKTEHGQNLLSLFSAFKGTKSQHFVWQKSSYGSWLPEADHEELNRHKPNENIELIPLPQLPNSIQRCLGGHTSSGITEFWVGLHLVQEQGVECFQWTVGRAADFPCH